MKKSKYATFLCDLIFRPNPKVLFLNFVFYAVEGIMLPLAAWSFGAFIDSVIGGGDNLRFYLGIYLFATVSQVLFVKFSQYVRENSIYSIQQYVDKLICGWNQYRYRHNCFADCSNAECCMDWIAVFVYLVMRTANI